MSDCEEHEADIPTRLGEACPEFADFHPDPPTLAKHLAIVVQFTTSQDIRIKAFATYINQAEPRLPVPLLESCTLSDLAVVIAFVLRNTAPNKWEACSTVFNVAGVFNPSDEYTRGAIGKPGAWNFTPWG